MFEWLKERMLRWFAKRTDWHVPKDKVDEAFSSDKDIGWNIYDPGAKMGVHMKKFFVIHYILKYKIFDLAMKLLRKALYKYIEVDIPKYHYNTNMLVFDKSYDDSIRDWVYRYKPFNVPKGASPEQVKGLQEKEYQYYMDGRKSTKLKFLKHLAMAIPLNDTAYSEFFNILMFNIMKNMNKEYEGCKQINHVFYSHPQTKDINYFHITKAIYDERKKQQEIVLNQV